MEKFLTKTTKVKCSSNNSDVEDDPSPTKKSKVVKRSSNNSSVEDDPSPTKKSKVVKRSSNNSSVEDDPSPTKKSKEVCDNTIQLGIKVPWPSEWSYNQWVEKKNKYPWLICIDGKIGCEYCKSVGALKTFQSKGVEISKEWCLTMIDGGSNTVKAARLTNLRHKILKHKTCKAHMETEKISQQNVLTC